jgi:hypothetical protein
MIGIFSRIETQSGSARAILPALICLACGGNSVMADASTVAADKSQVPQALHWRGKAQNLEVHSINGPVHAALGTGSEAAVVARILENQHGLPLRLHVTENDGRTLVCVGSDASNECHQQDHLQGVSVALEVQVPRGTKFTGRTVNGPVEAHRLEGEVEAHTQNGSVRIETTGIARASTVNGPIRVKLGAPSWTGTVALESVNGALAVEVPHDIGAELRADSAHGSVRVAPQLNAARVDAHHVEGRLGKGGGDLRLQTVNGSIDVR